ncbi:MAG: hypothetical protein GMKNLPBB_02397 [Myxococcota bacterium]|nr:hypothetical protein [Myxococcota bacterium]
MPGGESIEAASGTRLLDAAFDAGALVPTICGGKGECLACVVTRVTPYGALSPPDRLEKKALGSALILRGERLSCQAKIEAGCVVTIPAKPGGPGAAASPGNDIESSSEL